MVLTATSGSALAAGFLLHVAIAGSIRDALGTGGMGIAAAGQALVRVLYGLAILSGGWFIAPKAWLALRRMRPDMNLLMTIAVVGAIGIEMALATALGYFGGHWLDGHLGTAPWLMWIGLGLGIVAGFRGLWRIVKKTKEKM